MKKAFLITLILLLGSLCFAEKNKIDIYEKMAETFFEKGTFIVCNFQEKSGNIVRKSVVNKSTICSINCYNDNIVIVYTNGNSDTCYFSNCEITQDRNGNIIINVTMLNP
ncbi:MAG: hypothetical protein J6T84_10415 [Spirochaetaceae bacterium]|nr:hypothetical protein [Spirochaetaceae bacterium]